MIVVVTSICGDAKNQTVYHNGGPSGELRVLGERGEVMIPSFHPDLQGKSLSDAIDLVASKLRGLHMEVGETGIGSLRWDVLNHTPLWVDYPELAQTEPYT